MEIFIGILIVIVLVLLVTKPKVKGSRRRRSGRQTKFHFPKIKLKQWQKPDNAADTEIEDNDIPIDYKNSYQRKYLLTKNEWYAYKKLRDLAAKKDLQICPKVRMLDLVEPRKGAEHYKTLFWKVQAKHVDFLICDKDMNIKAVLELDDNSHNANDRKERDTFVDEVLTSVGYKVIRTKYINDDTLDCL